MIASYLLYIDTVSNCLLNSSTCHLKTSTLCLCLCFMVSENEAFNINRRICLIVLTPMLCNLPLLHFVQSLNVLNNNEMLETSRHYFFTNRYVTLCFVFVFAFFFFSDLSRVVIAGETCCTNWLSRQLVPTLLSGSSK